METNHTTNSFESRIKREQKMHKIQMQKNIVYLRDVHIYYFYYLMI